MAEKRVLARLLRLRELEEELSRQSLELAVTERRQVQREMEAARSCEVQGRANFVGGLGEADSAGRVGGTLEMEFARRRQLALRPLMDAADERVSRQREEFLHRRMERRQVETLVANQRTAADVEAGRRAQQMLDDWYGRRSRVEGTKSDTVGDRASLNLPGVRQESGHR